MPSVFVTVAYSCADCGGDVAVIVTSKPPTEAQLQSVVDDVGGGYCVTTKTITAEVDPSQLVDLSKECRNA